MAADILLKVEKKVLVLESSRTCGGAIRNYTIGDTMEYLHKKVEWLESEDIRSAWIEVGSS